MDDMLRRLIVRQKVARSAIEDDRKSSRNGAVVISVGTEQKTTNHGRFQTAVPHPMLDGSDIKTRAEHSGGVAVPTSAISAGGVAQKAVPRASEA